MNPGEARRWVEKHFGNERRAEQSARTFLPDDHFAAALEHIDYLPRKKERDQIAIERLLYAGCKKFDRWFAPSPPSVPAIYRQRLRAFADAFSSRERFPTNAPVFLVHALRDDLYAEFAAKALPIKTEHCDALQRLKTKLSGIIIPQHPDKAAEVLTAKDELNAIIDDLSSGKLRTRLKTSLPYPLTRQPTEFRMVWEGLEVLGHLNSTFTPPPGLLIQTAAPDIIRPLNTTRWQYGTTVVELEVNGLLDPSLQVPSLQMPAVEVPVDAWPNGLRVAYEIIYLACWAMRGRSEFIGIWVPAPGDLSEIESAMIIRGDRNVAAIRRSHPSMVTEISSPSAQKVEIDLAEAPLMEWHQRCRVLAEQYAMFGEAREAIFWLNVGVESMLRVRMEARIRACEINIDLDVLDGGKSYWDEAKQLVASKYPELAEEISWPAGGKKPSLFQQLKYFCASVPRAPDVGITKANYSKVSRRRNTLFHGLSETAISIEDVRIAMSGFDWLQENFCVDEA